VAGVVCGWGGGDGVGRECWPGEYPGGEAAGGRAAWAVLSGESGEKMGTRLKSKNFTDVAEFLRESISDEDLKERLEIVKKEFAGDQDFWRGLYDVRRGKLSLQMAKHPICDYKATRGILPWKEGDEPAEDSIRRLRGGES
jgi:hypothetical protein